MTHPEFVVIHWRDDEDRWSFFWLLRHKGHRVQLQGAHSPEGYQHDGDLFWAGTDEIRQMIYTGHRMNQ